MIVLTRFSLLIQMNTLTRNPGMLILSDLRCLWSYGFLY